MKRIFLPLLFIALSALLPLRAAASDVIATIPPLHSLVQAVMGGTDEALLLIDGRQSPHHFAFKPSQVAAMHEARLVFYVSDDFETYLPRVLDGVSAEGVALAETPDLLLHPLRTDGVWAEKHHDDHDDHGHDDHGKRGKHRDHDDHDDHDDHGKHRDHDDHDDHDKHGKHRDHDDDHDDHGDHDGHSHHHAGDFDLHIWLDPANAKKMVAHIAAALSRAYPARRDIYQKNAADTMRRLDELDAELRRDLAPVKSRPYVVMHDAYRYFEERYDLTAVGAVADWAGAPPTARHLSALRESINARGARCVFSETQLPSRAIAALQRGTRAKSGVLDPLGNGLTPGGDLYFLLLRGLSAAVRTCLAE